jgi:hypothetical protein
MPAKEALEIATDVQYCSVDLKAEISAVNPGIFISAPPFSQIW